MSSHGGHGLTKLSLEENLGAWRVGEVAWVSIAPLSTCWSTCPLLGLVHMHMSCLCSMQDVLTMNEVERRIMASGVCLRGGHLRLRAEWLTSWGLMIGGQLVIDPLGGWRSHELSSFLT